MYVDVDVDVYSLFIDSRLLHMSGDIDFDAESLFLFTHAPIRGTGLEEGV